MPVQQVAKMRSGLRESWSPEPLSLSETQNADVTPRL
jgi:hypothetical protein